MTNFITIFHYFSSEKVLISKEGVNNIEPAEDINISTVKGVTYTQESGIPETCASFLSMCHAFLHKFFFKYQLGDGIT